METDRTLLTDSMWAALSALLPGHANCRGTTATARDTCGFVEAVLWRGHTGVSWRGLPQQGLEVRWQQLIEGVWPRQFGLLLV